MHCSGTVWEEVIAVVSLVKGKPTESCLFTKLCCCCNCVHSRDNVSFRAPYWRCGGGKWRSWAAVCHRRLMWLWWPFCFLNNKTCSELNQAVHELLIKHNIYSENIFNYVSLIYATYLSIELSSCMFSFALMSFALFFNRIKWFSDRCFLHDSAAL